jgi:hypothetical protein
MWIGVDWGSHDAAIGQRRRPPSPGETPGKDPHIIVVRSRQRTAQYAPLRRTTTRKVLQMIHRSRASDQFCT